MFRDRSVHLSIELNKERFVPGDGVSGTLTVLCESPLTMEYITVSLRGRAISHAQDRGDNREQWDSRNPSSSSATSSTRTRTDEIQFFTTTTQVFPPPYYAQGLKQSCLTIQAGTHTYPFQFKLPLNCENAQSPEWAVLPLPPSCTFPSGLGKVEYAAEALVGTKTRSLAGLLSASPRGSKQFEVFNVAHPSGDVRQIFARRALAVPIYKTAGTLRSTVMHAFGVTQPAFEQRMTAEMRLPARGVHLSPDPVPISSMMSLTLTRDEPVAELSDKPTLYVVGLVQVLLRGFCKCQAQGVGDSAWFDVFRYTDKPEWPITFTDGRCDLAELLAGIDVMLPSMPTLALPTLQVSYSLEFVLGVTPTVGHPVKTMCATLTLDVPILPVLGDREPPPYVENCEGPGPSPGPATLSEPPRKA